MYIYNTRLFLRRIFVFLWLFSTFLYAKDYRDDLKVKQFISYMVKVYNFKPTYLRGLFKEVEIQKQALRIIDPATPSTSTVSYPKYGSWDRYVKLKVTPKRIKDGVRYLKKYKSTFAKVEKRYGVPKEYIAAIIGIESVYGGNVGKFPIFDTLTTLAFEPNRRSDFFKKQLAKFILLSYREGFNPKQVKGSYAGAIGLCQFMPSNYEAYGVDFNKDGKIRMNHPADAIASVANYLKQNGWRSGEPVATRVSYEGNRFNKYKTGYNRTYNRNDLLGITPKYGRWDYKEKVRLIKLDKKHYDELWYGAKNFYVITRYNHSAYYAMSVHQLAQEISRAL